MIGIEIHDGQVILTLPKCVLVLTRAQFIAGLKAGKRLRRQHAMAARVGKAGGQRGPGGDFPASLKN